MANGEKLNKKTILNNGNDTEQNRFLNHLLHIQFCVLE